MDQDCWPKNAMLKRTITQRHGAHCGTKHDARHHAALRPSAILRAAFDASIRDAAASWKTSPRTRQPTPAAANGIQANVADLLDVEAARVVAGISAARTGRSTRRRRSGTWRTRCPTSRGSGAAAATAVAARPRDPFEHRLDLAGARGSPSRGCVLGREVVPDPPDRPEKAEAPVRKKTQRQFCAAQHERDQRRRHDHADGGARVDDAHGRGAFLDGEPLGDGARRRRESRHPRPARAGSGSPPASPRSRPARGSRRPATRTP